MIPITGHTQLTALLGSPVAHSISPLMHNEAFHLLDLDYTYLCFNVNEENLETAVMGLKTCGIRGFNLTMPNKNKIVELLDELSPAARLIGAVNTVVNDNGRLTGYNTDGVGYMQAVRDAGYDVISVGKIFDIFDGEGLTESNKSKSSVHGMEQTIDIAKRNFKGLCFTNLVDFDALWGHRRNPIGYGEEIERFDKKLGELLDVLREDDLVILTADHGNDPTYIGTDHTREKVPFIAYSPSMRQGGNLPEQQTFAVIGATIADNFGVEMPEGTIGHSILQIL